MNEPIISPWVFYLIAKVDWIFGISIGISIILACFWLWYLIDEIECRGPYGEYLRKEYERFKSRRKLIQKFIIIPIIITIITPASNTLTKMIVASQVTPHNIEVVGNTIENSVDYIFDKINEVVDEREVE